ncbi:MAG: hypothetical protein K8R74_16475 [Bacteroidales bacterium]|nr:hypothetical protein [Bacteroidales bacterium]
MKKIKVISLLLGMFVASMFLIMSSCEKTEMGYCICDCYNSSGVYIYRTVERMAEDECQKEIQSKPDCDCFWDKD